MTSIATATTDQLGDQEQFDRELAELRQMLTDAEALWLTALDALGIAPSLLAL